MVKRKSSLTQSGANIWARFRVIEQIAIVSVYKFQNELSKDLCFGFQSTHDKIIPFCSIFHVDTLLRGCFVGNNNTPMFCRTIYTIQIPSMMTKRKDAD